MRSSSVLSWLFGATFAFAFALAHCDDSQFVVAGPTGDAGPSDASSDGSMAVDAHADAPAGGRFCGSSRHAFCADFDDGDPLSVWLPSLAGGGKVTLDSTVALSAPISALFTLPGAGRPEASLTVGLTPATHVTCRFGLRVTSLDPAEEVLLIALGAQDAALDNYEVHLGIGADRSYAEERGGFLDGGNIYTFHGLPTLPLGSWRIVTLDLVLASAGKSRGIVSYDDLMVGDFQLTASVGRWFKLTIGPRSTNLPMQAPTELRFDNITCDAL